MTHRHLFCFGLGYSAQHLATSLADDGWKVSGTVRNTDAIPKFEAMGWKIYSFDILSIRFHRERTATLFCDTMAQASPNSRSLSGSAIFPRPESTATEAVNGSTKSPNDCRVVHVGTAA